MAQNIASNTKSLSDSELSDRNSKQFDFEQTRTKRNSGSHLPFDKITMNYSDTSNTPRKALVDYEICDDAISTLENFIEPSTQTEIDLSMEKENVSEILDNHQQVNNNFIGEVGNSSQDETITSEDSSLRNVTASLATEKVSFENEQATTQSPETQPSTTDFHREKEILPSVEDNTNHDKQPTRKMVGNQNSSPYAILEVLPKENSLISSEDFIGEPRCLTLKKYTTDDDDMDDALELNFDEYDEDEESIGEQPLKSVKKVVKLNPNDMFLDDDDDDPNGVNQIKTIQYINLTSPKQNWERPIEREEGELTPDLYSTTHSDGGESKRTRQEKESNADKKESNQETKESNQKAKETNKGKESNQDFFLKINRCFRQLEREFCNMHVPRGSRRMIGQLQNTLCNVDRMKRRLAFLIDSAKHVSSDKSKTTPSSRAADDKHTSSRKGSIDDKSKSSKMEGYKSTQSHNERSRSERITSMLQNSLRSQREAEAKINRHIRRTASSISYAGTKQEKQRIQSLFRRQMNLITQHVIQRNDTGKGQNLKAGGSRLKKGSGNVSEGPKVPELKTLDEMEAFLAVLKAQKKQKMEDLAIENQRKQRVLLRFTTKKDVPVAEKRLQPVLLMGANQRQTAAVENQNENFLHQSNVSDTEREKQVEILKIMSEKRKEILENKKEYEEVKLLQEQLQKLNALNNPPGASEFSMNLNSTKFQNSREQNCVESVTKGGRDKEEPPIKEMELKKGEEASSKEVIDSFSVKRNSKEMECIKPPFHSRFSDFEAESREIIPENSKKRKKRNAKEENSDSESDSDSSDELKDQILKKRKRNESGGKLSSEERKKDPAFERKSRRTRHRFNAEEATVIDDFDEKLRSKKLFIVGDENLDLSNERFCLEVIGNQIYLRKMGKIRRTEKERGSGCNSKREQRNSRLKSKESNQSDRKIRRDSEKSKTTDKNSELETAGHTLKEMEEFLQQLRAKKRIASEERDYVPKSNQQTREMKFMARIQAKRKAKLMACVSATPDITEKEAKFLKDLENRSRDPCDSPDTERKKQKLMQKIREETDAIVLAQKQNSINDDPLSDVKTFLNMIKEAESGNDENSKQFYVSFSLKRSDVKQLENITTGKASALTEESQKFLNSVRAKMRAKKAPTLEVSECPGEKS